MIKNGIYVANDFNEDKVASLEKDVINIAMESEEVIIGDRVGFNNRLSNITAHDINIKLGKTPDGEDIFLIDFSHYINGSANNFFKISTEVKEIRYNNGTFVFENWKTLDRVIVSFNKKRISEFVQYYYNFNELKIVIMNKFKALLDVKGSIMMNSSTVFYPNYHSDGELTMKGKVIFSNIRKIDLGLMVVQENEDTVPEYALHFDITTEDDRDEFDIEHIVNISVFSNMIIVYRSIGMPVFVNLMGR